jgi:hypothetical protein
LEKSRVESANQDRDLNKLYGNPEISVTAPLTLLTGNTYDTPGMARYRELSSGGGVWAAVPTRALPDGLVGGRGRVCGPFDSESV